METKKPDSTQDSLRKLTRHERGLWWSTVAVIIVAGATITVLTLGAAAAGVFSHVLKGYLLAGGSFALLGIFLFYTLLQRRAVESSRKQILWELEKRSAALTQANRSLKDALQIRDTFLDTVSHELKTPLTCMLSLAEFVSEERDPDQMRTHAQSILEEGKGLVHVINQLMDLSLLKSGELSLYCRGVDLNHVLGAVVAQVGPAAEKHGVHLEGRFAEEPLTVWIDPRRITQVVEILLENALERSQRETAVVIRTRVVDADWVEFIVEDRSHPLSEAERQELFQPFSRMEARPQGRAGHLGLELPLVHQLITAHGGIIQVQDAEPMGMEFCVTLPHRAAGLDALDGPSEATLRLAS